MKDLKLYLSSWADFKFICEEKVKDRCYLTNKNWLRLREYHMERFLESHKAPYGFLYRVKLRHPNIYHTIHCMSKYLHHYKMVRDREFGSNIARRIVTYPNWIGFFKK